MRTHVPDMLVLLLSAFLIVIGLGIDQLRTGQSGNNGKQVTQITMPECCDSHAIPKDRNWQFIQHQVVFNPSEMQDNFDPGTIQEVKKKASFCRCDTNLALIDTTKLNEEERAAVASSQPRGEGLITIPNILIDRSDLPVPNAPSNQQKVKIAILDSGLSRSVKKKHKGKIKKYISTYPTGPSKAIDKKGHGTAIFTIIESKNPMAEYYIYKCLMPGQGGNHASAFALACALRCAEQDNVDIINISLGSYVDIGYISDAIEDISRAAIFASKGNDCVDLGFDESTPHYPSDYENVFGIGGFDANCFTTPNVDNDTLWACSNAYSTSINHVAPARLHYKTPGRSTAGTSFSSAYAAAKFAMHLSGLNIIPDSVRAEFKDRFVSEGSQYVSIREKYIHAIDTTAEVTIIE